MSNDKSNERQMLGEMLQRMPDALRDQLYTVRNGYEEKRFGLRNVMLSAVATFIGVALSMCSTIEPCNARNCMIAANIFGLISGGMLIFAQRRLPRQQGEIVDKIFNDLKNGRTPDGYITSTPRWHERWCERLWGIPFTFMLIMAVASIFI